MTEEKRKFHLYCTKCDSCPVEQVVNKNGWIICKECKTKLVCVESDELEDSDIRIYIGNE